MKKTALLVIDVQNAVVQSQKPELYAASSVITNICALVENAREHSVPVFFIRHESRTGDFKYGSEGWKLYSDITPRNNDTVVGKWSDDAFKDTTLLGELQTRGIEKLVIAGLLTESGIDATVKSAERLGYETIVAAEAHSTFDRQLQKASVVIERYNRLWSKSARVLNTAEVDFTV